MADALDRHYLGTAVLFFLWLCLGALIMDCGSATVTPKEAASR
jgi:hypothetical protein